jgi:hypothetical protein
MLRRVIAFLIALAILGAIGLLSFYIAVLRPIETETCSAVERYFAVKREAYATLDAKMLESAASGGALLELSNLVEGRKTDNDRLFLTTTIEHCTLALPLFPDASVVFPSASKANLVVGFTTRYFTGNPNAAALTPYSSEYLNLLFLATKVDDTWKINEITSPT